MVIQRSDEMHEKSLIVTSDGTIIGGETVGRQAALALRGRLCKSAGQ
jgi:hypothetical protein